jgi:hypothetical protein
MDNQNHVEGSPKLTPKEISGAEIAFGPSKISDYLPAMAEIPKEFHRSSNDYVRIVSSIFFSGGSVANWVAKPGIDKKVALNHFRAVLGSFAPKHEHKEAGCAYMLSEWFTPESLGIKSQEAPRG